MITKKEKALKTVGTVKEGTNTLNKIVPHLQTEDKSKAKIPGSIHISYGKNRNEINWKPFEISWDEFAKRLKKVNTIKETMEEFNDLDSKKQGELKDGYSYVGGLVDGRRKKETIEHRDILTLDADNVPEGIDFASVVEQAIPGIAFVIHSTIRHTDQTQRFRLLIPVQRITSRGSYEATIQQVFNRVGKKYFDEGSGQWERFMYYPKICSDAEYIYYSVDGTQYPAVLAGRDHAIDLLATNWPDGSRHDASKHLAGGLIYARWNENDVVDFIADVVDNAGDEEKQDRIRAAQDTAKNYSDGKKITGWPSLSALIGNDVVDRVRESLGIKRKNASEDFTEFEGKQELIEMLDFDEKCKIYQSIKNIETILQHDPELNGALGWNDFIGAVSFRADLPWRKYDPDEDYSNVIADKDHSYFMKHMEKYGITSKIKIEHGIVIAADRNRFHPVREYIKSIEWDGKERMQDLISDYLGAHKTGINRIFTRRALISAVARVFQPGCKADEMLVLVSPRQGTGKSTLISKLAGKWFSDTLDNLNHKDAYGQLEGSWIIEISEMTATRKTEKERMKAFLTSRRDKYRKAFGKCEEVVNRQNIFIGTSNDLQFITDQSGGRRFWPIHVDVVKPEKDLWTDLTENEVAQVWAEAYQAYMCGERWHLSAVEEAEAQKIQSEFTEVDPMQDAIEEYLDTPVPAGWSNWSPEDRRRYKHGENNAIPFSRESKEKEYLHKVNAHMIGNEVLNKKLGTLKGYEIKEISRILRSLPGWEYKQSVRVEGYGRNSGFVRKVEIPEGFLPLENDKTVPFDVNRVRER